MKTLIVPLCIAALGLAASADAQAGPALISEGFDNVADLAAKGWIQTNQSSPAGTTGWFQGNPGVLGAQSGTANSYIGANYRNAASGGSIANWLITPTFSTTANGVMSFFARTDMLLGLFSDSLEVRFNGTGSTNLADFSTLVLSINGTQAIDGFPDSWTQFTAGWAGTGGTTQGRFAFVYSVANADSANYIGIDSVSVNLPEPASFALVGAALAGLAFARRRKA